MEMHAEGLDDKVLCIRLAGRFDIQGTQQFETRLAAHMTTKGKNFIVDLSRVTFLASIGIRALLSAAKAAKLRGAKVFLLDPIPEVAKVLSSVGVDTLIPVCTGIDSARALAAEA
jgi:anti-anti-sigma factor